MLSGQKMQKKGEKWPKHPQNLFGGRLGSKVLQKKCSVFFTHFWSKFGRNCEKNGGFGDFEKAKFPKFWPKLAEKQHLLKKIFFQFCGTEPSAHSPKI